MKRKGFIIQWNMLQAQINASFLEASGWEIEIEADDEQRALTRLKLSNPEVIIFDLSDNPERSFTVAERLAEIGQADSIPKIFIDGNMEACTKAQQKFKSAIISTSRELSSALKEVSGKAILN